MKTFRSFFTSLHCTSKKPIYLPAIVPGVADFKVSVDFKKRYILFLCIILHTFSFSQQFKYSAINTENGLPSSEVYSVLQDRKGYMWFATDHGVARYNGKEITTYNTADGLPDNTIFRMVEDRKGRIWFASQSNEISYWENGSFHKSEAASAITKKRLNAWEPILTIYVDYQDNIWVNSIRRLIVIKAKSNYTESIELSTEKKQFAQLFSLGNNQTVFSKEHTFKTNNQPYLLDFKCRFGTDTAQHYSITVPTSFTRELNSHIYCGFSKKGIFYFASAKHLFIIEKNKPVRIKEFDRIIIKVMVDNRNNLWLGFIKGGVSRFTNSDIDSKPISLFENYSVDDVCQDHEGGFWFATLEKGVFYVPSTSILDYSNIPAINDHITFIGNLGKQIYVNTQGNKPCKKEGQTFVVDERILAFTLSNGGLYYITRIRDTTYYSFAGELVRFAHSKFLPKRDLLLVDFGGGKLVFTTSDNSIWLFYGGGLKKINNKTTVSQVFPSPFRATYAIPRGNDIFISGKNGLYLFRNGTYKRMDDVDTLLKTSISSLAADKRGNIWVATIGEGVLRLKDNKVMKLGEKDGLLSNICTAITVDSADRVWVGSNKGISCLQKSRDDSFKIKNMTTKNGLISNEISKLFASENSLWVGTMSGLNEINIPEALRPIPPSPAYISTIKVNNSTVNRKNVFEYNENNLKFSLHGLTFKDNGNQLYRYRLYGFDSTWQETPFNELSFNNLAPGTYEMQVQVGNTDRIWSLKPAKYFFSIRKPFWLTWWFIVLEVIALIIIVYLIILWRTSIIKKKEHEKLRINKLLTEYQMKALTAQMNPHFIFNAINSIQNFIIQNHSTLAYDYLIKFSKLIRLVLNNSKENEIPLQQDLDTLALYIELEQLRFQNSFDYRLQVDPEIDTESLLIPALLLQPYIENAIWHGLMPLKNRKGVIELNIVRQDTFLKITIMDNGVGRKASDQIKKKIIHKRHESVGMELTGKRIELFGQESQFSIQIIDNFDDNDEPKGTTVEIILPMVEHY